MNVSPDMFLDYGSIGVFLSFMIYQFFAQKKEIKELTSHFFVQLEKLEEKFEAREQELRKRYDIVIKDYQTDLQDAKEERSSLRSNIEDLVKKQTTEIKNVGNNQNKIFEIFKEWQQEVKLIHLTRKLDRE